MDENEIGTEVVHAAIRVHRELGSGMLESLYESVLADELNRAGFRVERQVPLSIKYRGRTFRDAFRADLIVDRKVIIELKCVERIHGAHKKQLLTYLRLTGMKLGYLINFNSEVLRTAITRVVNNL